MRTNLLMVVLLWGYFSVYTESIIAVSRSNTSFNEEEIFKPVDDPNRVFKEAVALWEKSDSSPLEYGQAALNMMIRDMVDRQRCISLGWALHRLGDPNRIINNVVNPFNGMGGMNVEDPKLWIFYDNKGGVELTFNCLGVLQTVTYRLSRDESKGWMLPSVSKALLMTEPKPAIAGTMWTKSKLKTFRESVQTYADRISELEWLELVGQQIKVNDVGKDNQPKPKEVEFLLFDSLFPNDLNRVIFRVKGRGYYVELYMDIWWQLVDGKWQPISNDAAAKMIVKPGIEQKSSGSDPNDK